MARYLLTERAYIADQLLEAGTEIGDGTQVPFTGPPGPHMTPMDKPAEKAVEAYFQANPGATLDPLQKLPMRGHDIGEIPLNDSSNPFAI